MQKLAAFAGKFLLYLMRKLEKKSVPTFIYRTGRISVCGPVGRAPGRLAGGGCHLAARLRRAGRRQGGRWRTRRIRWCFKFSLALSSTCGRQWSNPVPFAQQDGPYVDPTRNRAQYYVDTAGEALLLQTRPRPILPAAGETSKSRRHDAMRF